MLRQEPFVFTFSPESFDQVQVGAVGGQIKDKDVVLLPLGYFGFECLAVMDFCVVDHDDRAALAAFVPDKVVDRADDERSVHAL